MLLGMETSDVLSTISTALVLMFSGVVAPVLKQMRDDIARLKKEVAECEKERREDREWRLRHEPIIAELQRKSWTARIVAVPDGDEGELVIRDANTATTEIFGYTVTELVGSTVEMLIDPGQRDRHRQGSHASEFDGRREINSGLGLHKDGRRFPVTVRLEAITFHGADAWAAEIVRE